MIQAEQVPHGIVQEQAFLVEKEMQKALTSSLNKILKYASAPLDFVQVCLASPWYDSQVRTAKLSRLSPFVVSKGVLDDMIKRELKAFEDDQKFVAQTFVAVAKNGMDPCELRQSEEIGRAHV